MPFNLNFPAQNDELSQLQLEPGQMLFVLGANGTGKSSLMQRFAQQNGKVTRKIAAHRQTWMNTDALDMTPARKVLTEQQIRDEDQGIESRYRDRHAGVRASMTIYEIIDAENVRARKIAAAVDSDDLDAAKEKARDEAPISVINELLRQSNIPVTITIRQNERLMANKNGGPEYSAAQLSDGERNALLIAGSVLTAPKGTLLIIDEPERHLHRSIISPLLSQLFERRPDCGFVISTHDYDLPMGVPDARTVLLRSCHFNGQNVQSWEADLLPANSPIDDILKRDLLGARRKILFVEGTESSLDKPLYSLIFPMVSVIPKGNCRDVELAVRGSRSGRDFHWLHTFGIVDGDGYNTDQVKTKLERGVYALPYYSVEAIYFHPKIVEMIAVRQEELIGEDAAEMAKNALEKGVEKIAEHTDRLSRKVTKKAVRSLIEKQIPNDDKLMEGEPITLNNDAINIHAIRKKELDDAVENNDWEIILTKCPVRESPALNTISKALHFNNETDYQKAVRKLLSTDDSALDFVRGLFGNLFEQLESSSTQD